MASGINRLINELEEGTVSRSPHGSLSVRGSANVRDAGTELPADRPLRPSLSAGRPQLNRFGL